MRKKLTRTTYEIPCKCGKSVTRFFNDIGEFYIDRCCKSAGYDDNGVLIQKIQTEEVKSEPEVKYSSSPYRTKPIRKYVKTGKFSKDKTENADN
jgi:hypothetical protein